MIAMGYDLFGNAPTTTHGEYFRANIWGWQNFREMMAGADPNHKAFNTRDWETISSNSGSKVPRSRCERMARLILYKYALPPTSNTEAVLQRIAGKRIFRNDVPGFTVDKLLGEWQKENPKTTRMEVDDYCNERLNDFVLFLSTCGGFACC